MGKNIKYRKSELYDRVVGEYDVFESGYDFMVFLAVLGYREDNPVRDNHRGSDSDGTQGSIGLENVYRNDLYRTIMACIAFQDIGDADALVDSDLQAERLSQYAAGGLEIAEREFGQTAGDPTDAIVNYIETHQEEDETYQGTLGDIVEAFDDQMMGIEQD